MLKMKRKISIILSLAMVIAITTALFPAGQVGASEVKLIFNAKADMSGIQGENNWYYRRANFGEFGLNAYTNMRSYYATGEWYEVEKDFTYGRIRNTLPNGEDSQSSGAIGDPARVFVAPYTGEITISLTNNSITADQGTSDVIRFRIYKNEEIIYPNASIAAATPDIVDTDWLVLGKIQNYYQDSVSRKRQVNANIFTTTFAPMTLEVEQGDSIIFRINKGSNSASAPI